jgi:hypothetical protein
MVLNKYKDLDQFKAASWILEDRIGDKVLDSTSFCNDLLFKDIGNSKEVVDIQYNLNMMDGKSRWYETENPVLKTSKSFTVAAWVYLPPDALDDNLFLKGGANVFTAVSQESHRVSAFHLGIRSHRDSKGLLMHPRWCFTLSPENCDENPDGCEDVTSKKTLDKSMLGKFIFIAAKCDYEAWELTIYIPELNEYITKLLPQNWLPWDAKNIAVVGRGKWEGAEVDKWYGLVRKVECFSKALNSQDILHLYESNMHLLQVN